MPETLSTTKPIVALDIETGGFSARRHALLSISLVELNEALLPVRHLDVYILPERDKLITREAAAINGYTPEIWTERGAVPLAVAMMRIASWLPKDAQPLAHNAAFDKPFFETAESEAGVWMNLPYAWRCSMAAFRALNDALGLPYPDAKLETLAIAAGHWKPGARGIHGSLADAIACAAGYKWCLEQIKAQHPDFKDEGADPSKTAKEVTA